MNEQLWTAVDKYIAESVVGPDAVLENALRTSTAARLPEISVTPNQGKLLHLLARVQGATQILEVGTLGAYSTIWLARALPPNGRLITLESDSKHVEVARANLERAGLSKVAEVRLGNALATLPLIATEKRPPFDFIFIDADKKSIPEYFEWAVALSRPGSVIVVDNVVREGAVLDGSSADANVRGVRRLNDMLRTDSRVSATTIQTVGSKGYDGFTVALVTGKDGTPARR